MKATIEVLDRREAEGQAYLNVRMGGVTIKGVRILGTDLILPASVELSPKLMDVLRHAVMPKRPSALAPSSEQPPVLDDPAMTWSTNARDKHIAELAASFKPDDDPGF